MVRRLAHEPLGWRPTTLEVTVRRYRCTGCGHVWRQDTSLAAEPRAKLSRRGLRWALEISQCRRAVDVAMTILGGPQVEPCTPRSPPPVQASRFPQTVPRTNRLPSTYGPRRFTGLHARDRPARDPIRDKGVPPAPPARASPQAVGPLAWSPRGERAADWRGSNFTGDSENHVSVGGSRSAEGSTRTDTLTTESRRCVSSKFPREGRQSSVHLDSDCRDAGNRS